MKQRSFPVAGYVALAALLNAGPATAAPLPPVIDPQTGEPAITSSQAAGSVARGGADNNQMLVDMFRRLEAMQQDLRELRGQFEEQAHVVEGIRQRQRDLYVDIDQRLRALETGGGARGGAVPAPRTGGSPPPAPTASAGAGPAAAPAAASGAQEQTAYEQAFELLKNRRYDEAIAAFRGYLAEYPHGSYADNAQYWIGEASYVLRRFPTAIEEFKKVAQNFPDSPKVPDAMVKTGFSYYELQEWMQARQVLEKLVADHPETTAARLAQQRLQQMKLEGR